MSRAFDWFSEHFDHFNERPAPGPDTMGRTYPPQHQRLSIFSELDRIMQEMLQQHFQSMNTLLAPNQPHSQIEDISEDSNLRQKMLKKPDGGYGEFSDGGAGSHVPNKDINLDSTIRNDPKLIDRIFQDTPPSNHPRSQEFNPFSQMFTPHGSQNNFTFSSQTVVVTRGEDGKLKYEKREIRQDAEGNREEIVTSSDDTDRVGQQFLQNPTRQYHNRLSPEVYSGGDGMFERIKNWFFPSDK